MVERGFRFPARAFPESCNRLPDSAGAFSGPRLASVRPGATAEAFPGLPWGRGAAEAAAAKRPRT